jgi:predicted Zn-dependent protease
MRLTAWLLAGGLGACSTAPLEDLRSNADVARLTEGQSRMWYAAEQLDDSIRRRGLVFDDAELAGYLQSVLERLYPEFTGTLSVKPFDSPHLNAFCLPNGHIYVNTGLLARLDNEAQLATILAHEAVHFTAQHSLQQRSSVDQVAVIGASVEILTGIPLSGSLLTLGILSGYSQTHEREADAEGFKRLLASGYDLREAPRAFEKLLEEVEALDIDQPFMFSSHPRLEDRIDSFNVLVAEHPQAQGIVGTETYLDATRGLREFTLQRYLDMNNHKVLLLILNNEGLRDRYTVYPDYYLGEAYRLRGDQGDDDLAIAAFERSADVAPAFAPAHRSLGVLLMKRGRSAEARRHLTTYLSLSPEAPDREYVEAYLDQLEN